MDSPAAATDDAALRSRLDELEARLAQEAQKLRAVQGIAAALGTTLNLNTLLTLIMDNVTALLDADRSTLYLVSDDGAELWSKIMTGNDLKEIRLRIGEGIAGWVAQSGETVNIPEAYADTRFNQDVDRRTGYRTRSILCMPMRNNLGRTVGVVQVLNKQGERPFTEADESLLALLAAQAAISIENSKLYLSVISKNVELLETQEKLEHKMKDLDLLFEIEKEINAAADLDELLGRLLQRAMDLLETDAGSILLYDEHKGDLYFRTALGRHGETIKHIRLREGEGIAGWVARRREAAIVNAPAKDARWNRAVAERVGYVPRNILCVPLVAAAEDEPLGSFELLSKRGLRRFDADDLKLLTLMAGQASRAIRLARAKEERLKEGRLAAIGQMLSGVLHDIKTPMTIISGYAQLMALVEDPAQRRDYADQVQRQFEVMGAMTREVLAFARGESNLLIRKVYLHKWLADVEAHLRQEFAGQGVELIVEPRYTGVAFFDETKLYRVVHNLARNAAEAMPHGGTFRLTVAAQGDRLVLTFADTGRGIPPELEGHLFEAFVTAGKKGGTGLGLAMVRKIVEEHQGEVAYTTAQDRGTTFVVSLPLERPAAEVAGADAGTAATATA
ncbi:MAG TPA: GAF domain-containing sensor histidine kinase [Polyangia bacterium]|jgi:signal transduction histidine kinase/putative methionine-R-sulfoxide reductase with GAF domain